jgi:integrase
METEENPYNIAETVEVFDIKKEDTQEEVISNFKKHYIITPLLVEEWKKWFLVQKFSLDTVDAYYSFIKRYVGFKVILCQKSIDRFREENMGSVSSSALKSLIKFLVYKKDFPESFLNLRFEKNKQLKKEPKTITPDEVEKIIDAMPDLKSRLLTQTIYTLALRVEEAFKLTWSDFDWSEWLKNKEAYGMVHLKRTKRNKFRNLPVNPVLMNNLYKNHNLRTTDGIPIGNLIFGDAAQFMELQKDKREDEHLNKEQLIERNKKHYLNLEKQQYRELIYRISLKTINKRISPHVLRHARATFLMENNTPIETIKEILGHESIATTQIYAKASIKKIREDLQKYDTPSKEINKEDLKNSFEIKTDTVISENEEKTQEN